MSGIYPKGRDGKRLAQYEEIPVMTYKSDAEFIRECEAHINQEKEHGYYGEPPMLAEAVARLKHGDKELKMLTNEAYAHAVLLGAQAKEIDELRGLLWWCRSEANFAHCDETAIARIDELVKENVTTIKEKP